MKIFVTGGAGFIGSHLCLRLLQLGHEVSVYDNLLLGKREHLLACKEFESFRFYENDLLDRAALESCMAGHDWVFHLAANSDISQAGGPTNVDLNLGVLASYNVLETMRKLGLRQLVFSSTSAVYGEAHVKPTPEDYGPLLPISLYGASKLGAEALCTAFSHNFGLKVWIFRFANIVGSNATHGAIYDFVGRLKSQTECLKVLGNGAQKKSYLHVSDCVDGLLLPLQKLGALVQVYNLASQGVTSVSQIANEVVGQMKVSASIEYAGGDRGWVGDVAYTWLDANKIRVEMGWAAKLNSDAAVQLAVNEVIAQMCG